MTDPTLAMLPLAGGEQAGYSFETPVWPRAAATLADPPMAAVTVDDETAEYAYVQWVDDTTTPPRIRVQRLVHVQPGAWVHSAWIDQPIPDVIEW